MVQPVRRWRQGQRGGPLWLCLAFAAAGREVRQSPLFRVAGAWRSLALSRLTRFFHLGYELEDFVFGVSRLRHGSFAVY